MPLFGAHMSIAGGLEKAVARLASVGGEALQIFTANQRQWRVKTPSPEAVARFREARRQFGDLPVASHDSYLINLASPKPEVAARSVTAFVDEIERCERLDIPFLVMHPGAHLGAGVEAGLVTLVANLDRALEAAACSSVVVLLETTAGQGTGLGADFAELARIIETSRHPGQLGVCLDTCHVTAAGYDLATPAGYERTMAEFARLIGLERLRFFHLNDSKKPVGSRVDRHEHIGKGYVGPAGFANLVNDPRFSEHPMVLETPKGEDLAEDVENLAVLRGLLAG